VSSDDIFKLIQPANDLRGKVTGRIVDNGGKPDVPRLRNV
jgi:hypothetical protein